jgi:hypothetical protein
MPENIDDFNGTGRKSSGFRTIILFKADDRAIFLFGFGKNEKENIDRNELQYFKILGNDLLSLNYKELENAICTPNLFGGKRLVFTENFWNAENFENAEKKDFFKNKN